MIDEQSSASEHDYASDRSAIGAAPQGMETGSQLSFVRIYIYKFEIDWMNIFLTSSGFMGGGCIG